MGEEVPMVDENLWLGVCLYVWWIEGIIGCPHKLVKSEMCGWLIKWERFSKGSSTRCGPLHLSVVK